MNNTYRPDPNFDPVDSRYGEDYTVPANWTRWVDDYGNTTRCQTLEDEARAARLLLEANARLTQRNVR